MSETDGPVFTRVFGRTLRSDLHLPLLDPLDLPAGTEPDISVSLSDTPLTPDEPKIGGSDDTTATIYRDRDGVLIALNTTGWVAAFRPGASTITVHPDARRDNRLALDSPENRRILGDRIVTGVLPYLPAHWGNLALHGAVLHSPFGGVLILGVSGFGKSTTSQILQRDFGWTILDDDTSMVEDLSRPVLTPMGARPRIRKDAAARLGITTDALPGYKGHKGAAIRSEGDRPTTIELSAVVSLRPHGTDGSAAAGVLTTERISAHHALGAVFESVFMLEPDRRDEVQRQFQLGAALSPVPHLRLFYDKSVHSPEESGAHLASAISHLVGE